MPLSGVDCSHVHDVRVKHSDQIVRSHRLRGAIGQLAAGVNPGNLISVRFVLLMGQFSICPDSLAQSCQFYAQAFVLDLARNFAQQVICQWPTVRVVYMLHGLVPVTLDGDLCKQFTKQGPNFVTTLNGTLQSVRFSCRVALHTRFIVEDEKPMRWKWCFPAPRSDALTM